MPRTTSISTLQRARRGDSAALNAVLRVPCDYALQVALGYLKDHHLAEDAAQTAMMKVAEAVRSAQFDPAKGSLTGFTRRVVNNTCIDMLRGERRDAQLETESAGPLWDDPALRAEYQADLDRVAWLAAAVLAARFQLKADAREQDFNVQHYQAFQLCEDYPELGAQAVADRLGMKVDNVRQILHRTRKKLLAAALQVLRDIDDAGAQHPETVTFLEQLVQGTFGLDLGSLTELLEPAQDLPLPQRVNALFDQVRAYLNDPTYERASRACRSSIVA